MSSSIGDVGTTLAATNNVTIEAAQNKQASSSFREDKKSGLFSSVGVGVTIGSSSKVLTARR